MGIMAKMTTLDGSQNMAYFTRELSYMTYCPCCPGINLIQELNSDTRKAVYSGYKVSLRVDSLDNQDAIIQPAITFRSLVP